MIFSMFSWRAKMLLAAVFRLCADLASPDPAGAAEYSVGAGDVLQIIVIDNPELATTARIDREGQISFPRAGTIPVGGLTLARVADAISARLAAGNLIAPQVAVSIQEYRARQAEMNGQVRHPGVYEFRGVVTLLELISRAGGLSPPAGGRAVLTRRGESTSIDLRALLPQGDPSLDTEILEGDSVLVVTAGALMITGEIRRPGEYRHEEGMTLLRAINLAGGFTEAAAPGEIRILRRVNEQEQVREKVGLAEKLLPDDILIVPKR